MTTYREDLESALAQYISLLGFWRSRTFEQPSITATLDERDLIKKNKQEHIMLFNEKFDEFLTYLLETFSSPEQVSQLTYEYLSTTVIRNTQYVIAVISTNDVNELEKLLPAAIPPFFVKHLLAFEMASVNPSLAKMFAKFANIYKLCSTK